MQKSLLANLRQFPALKRLVIGVSGGVDSISLAHALHELGYELIVTHVNHQLRGEADADEAFVKAFAQERRLTFVSKKLNLSGSGNTEAKARKARYRFLEQVFDSFKASAIVTAHHEDDQIETILMHQNRGAGLRGMSGMKMFNGHILRPLLNIPKTEVLQYAEAKALEWREDKTNQDKRLTRNKIRLEVLPKLKSNERSKILKNAEIAHEKLDFLQEKATAWLANNFKDGLFRRHVFKALTPDLQSEILIQLLGAKDLYGKHLSALVDFIQNGESGKQMTIKDRIFLIEYEWIRTKVRKPECLPHVRLSMHGIRWGKYTIKSTADEPLFVRPWQAGDRFQPSGMNGHKKLQDFFTDEKIPRLKRHEIPVIVNEKDEILSVGNLRFSENGKALKNHLTIN